MLQSKLCSPYSELILPTRMYNCETTIYDTLYSKYGKALVAICAGRRTNYLSYFALDDITDLLFFTLVNLD